METPLVTIIIPVYNTAPWLAECLDSALQQDYPFLEIICADDGYSDDSPEILNEYSQKDKRIRILRQENHGQGYARNRALEIARGKYILFLDSDDMLEQGIVTQLVSRSESDSLDFLTYNFRKILEITDGEADTRFNSHIRDYPGVHTGVSLFSEIRRSHEAVGSACLGFYNSGFLHENRITFPEGVFYEDELWIFQCYLKALRCGYLPTQGYLYRIRDGSTTTTTAAIKNVVDCYCVANQMIKLCAENTDMLAPYPEFHKYALTIRLIASDLYHKNRETIRSQVRNDFDQLVLEDLDRYWRPGDVHSPQYRKGYSEGQKDQEALMLNSATWEIGSILIRPLHQLKQLFNKSAS